MVMAHMGEEDEKRREREKVRETAKGRDRKKKKKYPLTGRCVMKHMFCVGERCVCMQA